MTKLFFPYPLKWVLVSEETSYFSRNPSIILGRSRNGVLCRNLKHISDSVLKTIGLIYLKIPLLPFFFLDTCFHEK